MIKTLAKAIRDILKGAAWWKMAPASEWRTRVANQLETASTQDQLFDALLELEGLITAYITLELTHYSLTARIATQPNRSEAVWAHARTLFQIYRRMAASARELALASGVPMRTVSGNLGKQLVGGESKSVLAFLEEVTNFVLISLLVGARSEAGQHLVEGLATGAARISVQIRYKPGPSSLLAFTTGGEAYCKAVPVPDNPFSTLQQIIKPITKGTGSGSSLGAPVWFDNPELDATALLDKTFNHQSVDEALMKILMGSISFSRDGVPFYTSVRIELLHELIHVLHNTRGANRERVKLPAEDKVWNNAEEYWTIAGGNICENVFNAAIGAPDRYGHGGMMLGGLDPRSEFAQFSLREHSGLH